MKKKVEVEINGKKKLMSISNEDLLGYSAKKRSADLIAHTKETVDWMVKHKYPLTAASIARHAGCSVSFLYKNKEIREYVQSKQPSYLVRKNDVFASEKEARDYLVDKDPVAKEFYTSLEEANQKIRELEFKNLKLQAELNFTQSMYISAAKLLIRYLEEAKQTWQERIKEI